MNLNFSNIRNPIMSKNTIAFMWQKFNFFKKTVCQNSLTLKSMPSPQLVTTQSKPRALARSLVVSVLPVPAGPAGAPPRCMDNAYKYKIQYKTKVEDKRYKSRSCGRSCPDTLAFWACETPRRESRLLPGHQTIEPTTECSIKLHLKSQDWCHNGKFSTIDTHELPPRISPSEDVHRRLTDTDRCIKSSGWIFRRAATGRCSH